jgi:hypothetical protein
VELITGKLPEWTSVFDGYGYGYGSGYWKSVFLATAQDLDNTQDATYAYWWSDAKGKPSNGGNLMTPAAPGVIEKVKGPINLCNSRTLHATFHPEKWKGERLWIVAMKGEVQRGENKIGGLEREIICEVPFR